MAETRRLVTRSDFDGLACAMMLKELGMIDEIKFVHPKDVQDGKIELTKHIFVENSSEGDRNAYTKRLFATTHEIHGRSDCRDLFFAYGIYLRLHGREIRWRLQLP